MTIKAILTDTEGTTSTVSFVLDALFPYATRRLPGFVRGHVGKPEIAAQPAAVRAKSGETDTDVERTIATLLQRIAEDRKATSLKALQGMVWAQGYRDGQLKGHVYPDAVQALRGWKAHEPDLYVYSSGSIQAQKPIFGCSEAGDLDPLFSDYFDTTSEPKRESTSYARIAGAIGLPAAEILFLSDVLQELDAARDADIRTLGLAREGGNLDGHPAVASFAGIVVERTRWLSWGNTLAREHRTIGSILSGLISLVILALDVWAIVNILKSTAETGMKIIWVLVIIILPVLGLIIRAIADPHGSVRP